MVQRKQEEIIEQLRRSKLSSYSFDNECPEETVEENDEEGSKGKSNFVINEEIDCFRYPAILLIGDTGEHLCL
jgi:hypothetical protein